jgi:MFS family permease
MPRVQRRERIRLDAPPEAAIVALRDGVGLAPEADGSLRGSLPTYPDGTLVATVAPDGAGGATVDLEAVHDLHVRFFQWFFGPVFRLEVRRGLRHVAATLRAAAAGEPPPRTPRPGPLTPPASFSSEQITLIATVSFACALASFAGALFGQNADDIARTYHISNNGLGESLAITRFGALFALVAAALADRVGRRRILLGSVIAVCIANGFSAVAPNVETFTAAQLLLRAGINAAIVVGGIAVVEEAPEGARAFAVAMLGLASGAGYAFSVVLLPLADISHESWRIAFGVSALTIALVPVIARSLRETRRYRRVADRSRARGRIREIVDPAYRGRLLLLAGVGFLANVFSAPSAQLTNRYLTDERGFSSSGIALLRATTNGVPGLIGILLAGRLSETRGRRPVAILGVLVGTLFTVAFFLGTGWVLWLTSTLAIVAAASGTLAVGTMDAEMFPTEVRGTSNALLLVCYVLGSSAGLLLAGVLSDPLGGLGNSIALLGIAPILAALFLLPRLPESSGRALDDVSPSEL